MAVGHDNVIKEIEAFIAVPGSAGAKCSCLTDSCFDVGLCLIARADPVRLSIICLTGAVHARSRLQSHRSFAPPQNCVT